MIDLTYDFFSPCFAYFKLLQASILVQILDMQDNLLEAPAILYIMESSRERLWLNEEKCKEGQVGCSYLGEHEYINKCATT